MMGSVRQGSLDNVSSAFPVLPSALQVTGEEKSIMDALFPPKRHVQNVYSASIKHKVK